MEAGGNKVLQRKTMYLYNGMLFLFSIIGLNVIIQTDGLKKIDQVGSQVIQNNPSSQLTAIYENISAMSSPTTNLILAAIIFLMLFFMNNKVKAIFFFGSFLVSGAVIPYIIKHLVRRERPIHQLVSETGYSFPSGHVASAVALYVLILWLVFQGSKRSNLKNVSVVLIVGWIIIVMLARVYLGAHYLSDVTASLLLCSGLTGMFIYYSKPLEEIIGRRILSLIEK